MSAKIKRSGFFFAIISAVLVMCVALTFLASGAGNASAASEFEWERTVKVGHITDTHYYPFRLCYTGEPVADADKDYFYNYIQETSSKMWLEAEIIFQHSLDVMLANQEDADLSNDIDYLIVSGDIGQDGELLSMIDVANKLRKLQNDIRNLGGTHENFQVFTILGNHDLYNPKCYRFDNPTGAKTPQYYTSRIDAVRIFAGLGFPNMTDEEASEFYAPLAADLPDGYEYVYSGLSPEFEYTWQFLENEAGKNATPIYSPNSVDDPDNTFEKMLEADKVKLIDNAENFSKDEIAEAYSYKFGDGRDMEMGDMTYIAARKDKNFTCIGMDVVMSNAVEHHVTGGTVQKSTLDFMTRNKEFARPDGKEMPIVATAHHSLIPHWDMEEEVTTAFIVYNWEEMSDFLADYGVRYVYTGHQHANDAVSRISFNGNQITDMESAANISVGSQFKVTEIQSGKVDGKYAENAYLRAYNNGEIKKNETSVTEALFDKVLVGDKFGYVKENELGDYIDLTEGREKIKNYSDYAQKRVYDNILVANLKRFLRKDVTEMLEGLAAKLKFGVKDLSDDGKDVRALADNLIREVNKKVLTDYTYRGDNPAFKAEDMKLFGYLEELVENLAETDVIEGEGWSVFKVLMHCYMLHNIGDNVETFEDLPPEVRHALAKFKSGEYVGVLIDKLLSRETGLMRLIEGLTTETFDLSDDGKINPKFKGLLEPALGLIGVKDADISKFNLGETLKVAAKEDGFVRKLLGKNQTVAMIFGMIDLETKTVAENIDEIVDKYLTDNFKQSLGEYAYTIITAFGVDGGENNLHMDVRDDNDGKGYQIRVRLSEPYTYTAKDYDEEVTVENGKKPSMLTNNFGKDPATTRNFTYFTDRRITKGVIEYNEIGEKTAKKVEAKSEIYGVTKELIDLGIWCQVGYHELTRHTVKLTGLKPDTLYEYRVGEPEKEFWSDKYTFRTAPEKGGSFDALISSDIQSSTKSAYERIDFIYDEVIKKNFPHGVDFLINPGDMVDNSRNGGQFKWMLNASPDVYGNYAMVVAAGNHDEKFFDLNKVKNDDKKADREDKGHYKEYIPSPGARVDEYNYLWSHYNYDLTEAQTQKTGYYFAFDYSDVHFYVLNTNDTEKPAGQADEQLGAEQYEWLKGELAKTPKDDYKVVLMHKSLYSEGSHSYDAEVVGMRKQLTPLFADNGVDLVLGGHDHTYNETFYLDGNGNKAKAQPNKKNLVSKDGGTLYVTMGTMGEKFYKYRDNPNVPTRTGKKLHVKKGCLSDPVYGKLVYDGNKLFYYGYQFEREIDENGNIIGGRSVSVRKGLSGGAIAGIVIGSAAGCAAIAVGAFFGVKATKKKRAANGTEPEASDGDNGGGNENE